MERAWEKYLEQEVVTHIAPVEPFANGIKLFDH